MTKYKIRYFFEMLLTVVIILSMTAVVYADDWKVIMQQNFSGISDTKLPASAISDTQSSFSAEIKNEMLELKSDSLLYFKVTDQTDTAGLNKSDNTHGMSITQDLSCVAKPHTETVNIDGKDYGYIGNGGNKAVCVEEIGGKTALKQFTYLNGTTYTTSTKPADALRTNVYRFGMDASKFSSSDNEYIIEVEYYTEDTENNTVKISYPSTELGTDGNPKEKGAVLYNSEKIKSDGAGEWHKAQVRITDVDFSKYMPSEPAQNKSFQIIGLQDKVNYYHSVAVYKVNDFESSMPDRNNTVETQFASDDIIGNVKLAYDMKLPTGEALTEDTNYNTGHNMMTVGFLDKNKVEAAQILYDIKDSDTSIYAVYSEQPENNQKRLIYRGDISDKMLTYVIDVNIKRTYSVEIYDGNTLLCDAVTDIPINNSSDIAGIPSIKYVSIKHNPFSNAIFAQMDNFVVTAKEDESYKGCIEDLNVISLPSIVLNDFELPSVGSVHSSEILWTSDNEEVISIENEDGKTMAIVTQSDKDTEVKLSAKVTLDGYYVSGDFSVTVKASANAAVMAQTPKITTESDGTVSANIVVKNANASGAKEISFVVASVDGETGEIYDFKKDSKTSFKANEKFAVSGLNKRPSDEIRYYIWDENNVSLINNSPTDVTAIKTVNKARAISLEWEESYDDYNALYGYEIYRDGKLIGTADKNSYVDKEMTRLENHSYSVVPIDTNGLTGGGASGEGCTFDMPYYISPIGKTETAVNKDSNGITMNFNTDPARIVYTEYAEVEDANGVVTACRAVSKGKNLGCIADKTKIHSQNGVVFEITYLDTEGDLTLVYNIALPEGETDSATYSVHPKKIVTMGNTRLWKTATVRVDDAFFRGSRDFSGCDFGIKVTKDKAYIKRIELIESSMYD